ncbi:hypothetical protein vseg_009911 [Gypsophila vaccaria]
MKMNKGELHYHEDTELRLGLPGFDNKRSRSVCNVGEESTSGVEDCLHESAPPKKVQAIGWPPIRSCYRKNSLQSTTRSIFVKVSMDGAPYLRKVDLNLYKCYNELIKALENMFKFKAIKTTSTLLSIETQSCNDNKDGLVGYDAITYEDKDGDWMLVGDVPWKMFTTSCKRLIIIKPSSSHIN